MLKRLKPIVATVMVASLVSACATLNNAVKEPEVSVTGMQVKAVSMSDMQMDFDLGIRNPNPLGVTLSGFSYQLDVDGKSLVSGDKKDKLKVAANGSSAMRLPLSIRYQDLAGGLSALREKDEVPYVLSGDLDFGLFSVPYNKRGTFKLPSLPRVSVAWVDIGRMTLSGMDITVVLDLENRNKFPINLGGIAYGLKVGDTTLLSGRSLRALTLKPDATGRLGIGISMSYRNMGHVVNMLAKSTSIPMALTGSMEIKDAGSVPFNWQGDVKVSH